MDTSEQTDYDSRVTDVAGSDLESTLFSRCGTLIAWCHSVRKVWIQDLTPSHSDRSDDSRDPRVAALTAASDDTRPAAITAANSTALPTVSGNRPPRSMMAGVIASPAANAPVTMPASSSSAFSARTIDTRCPG